MHRTRPSGQDGRRLRGGKPAAELDYPHLSLAPHSAQYSEPDGPEAPHMGQTAAPADAPV